MLLSSKERERERRFKRKLLPLCLLSSFHRPLHIELRTKTHAQSPSLPLPSPSPLYLSLFSSVFVHRLLVCLCCWLLFLFPLSPSSSSSSSSPLSLPLRSPLPPFPLSLPLFPTPLSSLPSALPPLLCPCPLSALHSHRPPPSPSGRHGEGPVALHAPCARHGGPQRKRPRRRRRRRRRRETSRSKPREGRRTRHDAGDKHLASRLYRVALRVRRWTVRAVNRRCRRGRWQGAPSATQRQRAESARQSAEAISLSFLLLRGPLVRFFSLSTLKPTVHLPATTLSPLSQMGPLYSER